MRIRHIDRMRAIAVLCMVEVHTAAIIPPEGITVGHPAAFIAAAFGGMAAPLFVTISGWGIHISSKRLLSDTDFTLSRLAKWSIPRALTLVLCQIIVNILLISDRGGRFEWGTPGVLTLLAVATLVAPIFSIISFHFRGLLLVLTAILPLVLGEYSGTDWTWWERVHSNGTMEWLQRLILNGTYPVLPWIFFVILGTLIHDFNDNENIRSRLVSLGILSIVFSVAYSFHSSIPWALTEGEAILTFFPASFPFLLVSGTFVILTQWFLEGDEPEGGLPRGGEALSFLEPAGKITLTIYVAHFAVLGAVAYLMQGNPRLDIIPAFLATIAHTLIWIPLAIWHQNNIPNFSIEGLLRRSQSFR